MASVRFTYPLKADMYLRHHGLHQFGPGSLSHDVLNAASDTGSFLTLRLQDLTKAKKRTITESWMPCSEELQ